VDAREGAGVPGPAGPLSTYVQLLSVTLVYPLTIVYFTALILGREGRGEALLVDRLTFVIGAAAASLAWQTLLEGFGSIFHGRMSPDSVRSP
jgi:arginine exporter protein ArgO